VDDGGLLEADTLWAKFMPFYWPTSERRCLDAEGRILSLAKTPITRRRARLSPTHNLSVKAGGCRQQDGDRRMQEDEWRMNGGRMQAGCWRI